MFLTGFSVLGWFNNAIHMFLLWLDQTVYWCAAQCYQLFMKLATAQIFTDDFFAGFARRIYAILGVFMLFYLVYALLNAIVDPDKLTKGDKGVGKIASNLVVSLVLLGLMPSIFSYAYRMQNFVLSSNLLGAVILGSDVIDVSDSDSIKENEESLIRFGDYVSFTVLNAFLNPENLNPTLEGGYNWYGLKEEILKKGLWMSIPSTMSNAVSNGVSIDGVNTVITYRPLISTAAGVFLIYVLLSFTLDLGLRVVKFAFYQLLAPIPIILRIIPSKKSTFDKWLKQTLSVYFEVFVRVALMYIVIYFINAITTNNTLMDLWTDSSTGKLALAVVIMGVFAFAKQAPKLISDVLGIDTGNLKLGITDKLKARGPIGNVLNKGIGAVSGSLGGMATGVLNKDVNTWAAMKQGFAGGFKTGGSQFTTQRDKTFKSYYGYNAEQGLLGGRSISDRLTNSFGKSVEKSAVEDANKFINNYERKDNKRSKFYTTLYNDLANGTQFDAISNDIRNSSKFSKIYEEARTKADNEAVRLDIKKSDPEYNRIYNKYVDDLMNRSTDANIVRGLKTQKQASELSKNWDKFIDDFAAKNNGMDGAVFLKMSDADLRDELYFRRITNEQFKDVTDFKAEWEQSTSDFAKNLADGTYSRETTGTYDKIYDERYKNARDQLKETGSVSGKGGVGVTRSKSDTDKLIDAIKDINK